MVNNLSEEALELDTIKHFEELGYSSMDCYSEAFGEDSTLGRQTSSDVILIPKLRQTLEKLNPELPIEAVNGAIYKITKDRHVLNPVFANKEVYQLLRNGVKVCFKDNNGIDTEDVVKVIDWNFPENNDFFITRQFCHFFSFLLSVYTPKYKTLETSKALI